MAQTRILIVTALLAAGLACDIGPQPVDDNANPDSGIDARPGRDDTDGSSSSDDAFNNPPRANAGPDRTSNVFPGDSLDLDGSGSSDIDGQTLDFMWEIISKPANSNASMNNADFPNPSIYLDKAGTYQIKLTVSDGELEDFDDLRIVVTPDNEPPRADAGFDQRVEKGAFVQLSGAGSSDPESDPLSYNWAMISRPPSSAAMLSGVGVPSAAVSPSFVADVGGIFTIQLTVTDDGDPPLTSQPDIVSITVTEPTSSGGGGSSSSDDCLDCAAEASGIASTAWTSGDVASGFGLLALPLLAVLGRRRRDA